MSVSSTEMRFVQVVDDYIAGKMTKEQTLELLKSRYEAVHKDIRKELGEDHISFCCYVPREFEEWIEICDGAERNKPRDSKWKNSHNNIQKVIDKVTAKYKENELVEPEKAEREAVTDVYREVNKIQDLCRENQENTDLYEKYRNKIAGRQEVSENSQVQETELVLYDKMPPRFQKMYDDEIITGEKINNKWMVADDKHGIKKLMDWAENNKEVFTTNYIVRTFCKRDGESFTPGSVNTQRSASSRSRKYKKKR